MKFEPKLSGTKVTDFNIEPIFDSQFICLEDLVKMDLKQETMNWLLDTLRFSRGIREKKDDKIWWATIDWDSIYKLSCLENYPEYVKEFEEYFGEEWLEYYIRFNH
jgi:hypothetical protein